MALKRREFLQISALAGLAAALPGCGSAILAEPDVTAAGFGENATGTVTMWCRGARVDGAGTVRTFTQVLRPLVAPGMATTALYAFLAAWTEFLGALTFLTSQNLYTLPVSLVNLQLGAYGQVNYGFLAAGAVIAMIPCVILFVALQRYYVEGLAAGGVKG